MVRTRFAPSPTGYLHIGGVRTALFNWLFARRHGGQFILRIDDTDQGRNQPEALQPILDGFRWLGLDWDEGAEVGGPYGPYYQSERLDRYQATVQTLLDKGLAYRDYATADEMKVEREAAEKEKRPFLYSRKWMAESAADRARFESEGRKGVVRLKMSREGVCRFHDHIRGDMAVEWSQEADHVIQRADGSCLYNLANVVDDHDMRITHVIRAEEHLSNTPRQIFIAQGLDYELPEYAHVPFVAEPGSKNKLSKRKLSQYLKNPDFRQVYEHGQAIAAAIGLATTADTFNPVIVDFYREVGYLPDAIVNYLLLLGWSLDDKTEFFTRSEMIGHFSLERVNKAPASFDVKKLRAFQDRYMALVPVERKTEMVLPFLQKAKLIPQPTPADVATRVAEIVRAASERIKVAGDILDYAAFFLPDNAIIYDEKALNQHVRKPEANTLLRKMRERLTTATFEPKALEDLMQKFAESEGIKLGTINQLLRVSVTGKAVGFGTYETLALLGRERNLARIDLVMCGVRMTDQDIFHREIANLGGRVPIEKFPNVPAAPVYARTREIANELIASAKETFPKLLPIHFDFVKNGSVNAWAFRSEGRYFIGLTSGAMAMLHLVLNRMLASPNIFPNIGQPTEEDPNLPIVPWNTPDAEYLFKAGVRPILPRCPCRAHYARHVAEQALLFLIGHEIAHITRGHVDYLESSTGSAFLAELGWTGTSEARLERQAIELDADRRSVIARAYSMHETAQHAGDQFPPWATAPRSAAAWQYDWAFAVNTVFRLFGDPRFSGTDLSAEPYPPLPLRRRMAIDTAANVLITNWGEGQKENIDHVLVQAVLTTEAAFAAIGAAPSGGGLKEADTPEAKAHISKINESWKELLNKLKPFSYERLDNT